MSMHYTHQVLKIAVAQICQSIGFQSIQPTAMELMVDILHRYMQEITRLSHHYAELYNRTEPNLDDVALAFKDNNVNLNDLEEYIQFVDPVKCAVDVPKYPLPKESHLNFLKPGSREVLTRPLYIHEHLPPIDPVLEDDSQVDGPKPGDLDDFETIGMNEPYLGQDATVEITCETVKKDLDGNVNPFKRPGEPPSSYENVSKRPRLVFDEGRPTRDLNTTSGFVMTTLMTTSGFISPAREGKLPDAKCPVVQEVKPQFPVQSSTLPLSSMDGKFDKKMKKKIHDKEKKRDKDKTSKDLFKPDKTITSKKSEAHVKFDETGKLIDSKSIIMDMQSNILESGGQIKSSTENQDEKLQSTSLWPQTFSKKTPSELKALKKQQKLLQQLKPKSSKQNRLLDRTIDSAGKKIKKNKLLSQHSKKGNLLKTQLKEHQLEGHTVFSNKSSIEPIPSSFMNKNFTDFMPPSDYYDMLDKTDGDDKEIKSELIQHPPVNVAPFSHLVGENIGDRKFHQTYDSHFSTTSSVSQVSTVIDGKISSAPDKAKLNIFKKIPSKIKEDHKPIMDANTAQTIITNQQPQSCGNVIVIDDDSPPHSYASDTNLHEKVYTKQEFTGSDDNFKSNIKSISGSSIQNYCEEQDHPLNLTGNGNKIQNLSIFPTSASQVPPTSMSTFDETNVKTKSGSKMLDPAAAALKKAQRKQKKESKLAAATAAAQQQQKLMQNFLPSLTLGGIGMPSFPYQFLPSRPGLIPESPLIPQFDPMRPFAWPMPGFGFPSLPHGNINPIVNSPRSDAAIPPSRGRGRPPLHQNHHLSISAQNKASVPSSTSIRPIVSSNQMNINKLLTDSKCNVASMVPDNINLSDVSLMPVSTNTMFQQQQQQQNNSNLYYPSMPFTKVPNIPKTPKVPKLDGIDRVPGKRGPKPKNKVPKAPFFQSTFGGQQLLPQQLFQPPTSIVDDFNKPIIIQKQPATATSSQLSGEKVMSGMQFSLQKDNLSEFPQSDFGNNTPQNLPTPVTISSEAESSLHKIGSVEQNKFNVDMKIYNVDSDEPNTDVYHSSTDNTTLAEKNLLASLNPLTPHSTVDDNSSDISTALVIEERSKKEKRSKEKEHKKERKEKDGKLKKKKEKKDKNKNKSEKKKERETGGDGSSGSKELKLSKKEKKEKRKEKDRLMTASESSGIPLNSEETSDDGSQISVPKLTLKLGQVSPRSDTPEKKISFDHHREKLASSLSSPVEPNREVDRDITPEHEFQLARISALVTRPTGKIDDLSPTINRQRPKTDHSSPSRGAGQSDSTLSDVTVTPSVSGIKKHDRAGRPPKEGRSSDKKLKHSADPTTAKDSEGNEIWICPACGRVDDGSPMIGCDACDAWYHWLCVGIRVPPEGSWYCRVCIARKQETFQTGEKKKKRKKKDKKEHQ